MLREKAIEVLGTYYDTQAAREYESLCDVPASDKDKLKGLKDIIKRAEERKK